MQAHIKYFWYVLRHKWFVFVAGLRLGVPLVQLITHDWSKFLPSEWGPYVANFYGYKPTDEEVERARRLAFYIKSKAEIKADFDRAWNHHQKRQPHHWQYWLLTTDQPGNDWALWQMSPPIGEYTLAYQGEPVATFPDDERPMQENARYLFAGEVRTKLNRMPVPLEMPERFVREMVADWMGAGRAITGRWEVQEWYAKSSPHIILHPSTRARVEDLLKNNAPRQYTP
jgi:hypothetical protein